jgi:hypothetical protein
MIVKTLIYKHFTDEMSDRPTGDDIIDWLQDLYDLTEDDVVPLPTLQNMENLFTLPIESDSLSVTWVDSIERSPSKDLYSIENMVDKTPKQRPSLLADLLRSDEKEKKELIMGPRDSTKETVGERAKRIERNLKSQQSNTEQSKIYPKGSSSSVNSMENYRDGIKIPNPSSNPNYFSPPSSPKRHSHTPITTPKTPSITPSTYSNRSVSTPLNTHINAASDPLTSPPDAPVSTSLDLHTSTNLLNTPVSKCPLSDALSPLTPVHFQSNTRKEISADQTGNELQFTVIYIDIWLYGYIVIWIFIDI